MLFSEDHFFFYFKLFIAACLGGIMGSFCTMLAYRLPRGLSIITPRSSCPSCKTTLGLADLVPLLSYIFSKGKCRHCSAPIGPRYFWIEAGCVLAAMLIALFLFLK